MRTDENILDSSQEGTDELEQVHFLFEWCHFHEIMRDLLKLFDFYTDHGAEGRVGGGELELVIKYNIEHFTNLDDVWNILLQLWDVLKLFVNYHVLVWKRNFEI